MIAAALRFAFRVRRKLHGSLRYSGGSLLTLLDGRKLRRFRRGATFCRQLFVAQEIVSQAIDQAGGSICDVLDVP